MIATHTKKHFDPPLENEDADVAKAEYAGFLVQNVWHATDLEGEWTQYPLCHKESLHFCEASICRLPDKSFLALMRENSAQGLPSFACYSDDGLNWSVPEPTRMFGCHRPVTGLLQSGNLLTTYREASHAFLRGFWAKNTFACLTKRPKSKKIAPGVEKENTKKLPKADRFFDFSLSVILPLDHDKSSNHCDSGYTGWVQMPDKSIFVVNYITNSFTMPHITWYSICEKDF